MLTIWKTVSLVIAATPYLDIVKIERHDPANVKIDFDIGKFPRYPGGMTPDDPAPVAAPRPYHHGDLRQVLVAAAAAELADRGIEGFTLRGVAKRAGVSHAAPAHHFRDTGGLLTALAAEGFTRFLATQQAREAAAPPDPRAQLVAAGLGYIEFALAHPALFRLMFASTRPDFDDPALKAAAGAAHQHLLCGIAKLHGRDPSDDPAAMTDATAAWAMVHGLADLLLAGRLAFLLSLPLGRQQAVAAEIIERVLPAGTAE
jgi:AcrR family transcriptional regulator